MGGMKTLAKETAIYGVSSILGRFLNWCLTPMYTFVLASTGEVGEVTNLYAITAFLLVMLTFGMETGFFRFVNKHEEEEKTVYATTLITVGSVIALFTLLVILFRNSVSGLFTQVSHPEYIAEYIAIMAVVVGLDAFSAIPFAYLRYKKKPLRFAGIKLIFVILNIVFNLFFLIVCPWLVKTGQASLIEWFYRPDYNVGYVFVANLLATFLQTLFLSPYLIGFRYTFDVKLVKRMLRYSLPLLVLGVAGIMNQTFDKMMMPFLIDPSNDPMGQLGIYGTSVKIAVVLTMFTQAFRYAYEPFVFGKHKENGGKSNSSYAEAMKYFIICSMFIFLGVSFYLDILKYIIEPKFWEGLTIVPIVMCGDIFMGIFFNLSLWYKLNDETRWGAWFSIIGFIIIVAINVLFVPVYGYSASAWAIFFSYLVMMLTSYFIGQKRYPIAYNIKSAAGYTLITALLFGIGMYAPIDHIVLRLGFRTFLLVLFIAYTVKYDLPLKEIPILNRYLKK
jgi:O-antigen/teichoic acid export membrane protein